MAERSFNVDLQADQASPALYAALAGPVVNVLAQAWQQLAREHVQSGDYVALLDPDIARRYPYAGDPDAVGVAAAAPYANIIEEGHAGFHLPSHWGVRGGKWKVSSKGTLFATVPFRSKVPIRGLASGSTPGWRAQQMPAAVYKDAQSLPNRGRLSGFGDTYKQSKSYEFYRQIWDDFPKELSDVGYTWKASQYENLYRFTSPTPGGGRHTEYMTFRTITPESTGWYIPPQPALHLAERALEDAAPMIEQIIDAAVAQDAMAALMQAGEGLE